MLIIFFFSILWEEQIISIKLFLSTFIFLTKKWEKIQELKLPYRSLICHNKVMPKKIYSLKKSLQRRIINKIILVAAIIQPLGTIPQIIVVYAKHNATSISISSWLLYLFFDLLWLWYGLAEKQKAIVVSSLLFTILEGLVAVGGFLYGGSW